MGAQIPPPADNEFEERLSWSPDWSRPDIAPTRSSRPSARRQNGVSEPAPADLADTVQALRGELGELRAEIIQVRSQMSALVARLDDVVVAEEDDDDLRRSTPRDGTQPRMYLRVRPASSR